MIYELCHICIIKVCSKYTCLPRKDRILCPSITPLWSAKRLPCGILSQARHFGRSDRKQVLRGHGNHIGHRIHIQDKVHLQEVTPLKTKAICNSAWNQAWDYDIPSLCVVTSNNTCYRCQTLRDVVLHSLMLPHGIHPQVCQPHDSIIYDLKCLSHRWHHWCQCVHLGKVLRPTPKLHCPQPTPASAPDHVRRALLFLLWNTCTGILAAWYAPYEHV